MFEKPNIAEVWGHLKKLIKYFEVELVVTFHTFPGYLCIVALIFLPLEKACRYNLKYSEEVCSNLNNGTLKAACGAFYESGGNKTAEIASLFSFSDAEMRLLETVCTAETEAQKLQVNINQYRAILGYLGLVVIMYIGPFGDKYNRKKLFLLMPMVGELINVLAYLTTSVFQSSVSFEFHLIVEKLTSSLSGGYALLAIGVFAYLASKAEEKDRTFRFGVLAIFQTALGTVVTQFSGPAYEYLGYVKLFTFSTIIHVLGVLFIVFYIDELPAEAKEETPEPEPEAQNFLKEGIVLFKSNFDIFWQDRKAYGKQLLVLIFSIHTFLIISSGEGDVMPLFARLSWGWTTEFGSYSAYNTAVAFVGSIIETYVFIKFFQLSDPVLMIISYSCILVSKPIFAFTKSTAVAYVAATLNMFASAQTIAGRSLLSKIVQPNELGRCYTIIAIADTIIHPLASVIYNNLYEKTISWFPGTFLFVSSAILLVSILAYLWVNVLFRRFQENGDIELSTSPAELRNPE